MSAENSFEHFEKELNRLVASFGGGLAELKKTSCVEAQLRDDFLNPFFRALGWDMENRAGLIQQKREVEIESRKRVMNKEQLSLEGVIAAQESLKHLWLMPKLRAATSDAEKAPPQNAVTATDHPIDQLVYELYELTPEEIALVEGA